MSNTSSSEVREPLCSYRTLVSHISCSKCLQYSLRRMECNCRNCLRLLLASNEELQRPDLEPLRWCVACARADRSRLALQPEFLQILFTMQCPLCSSRLKADESAALRHLAAMDVRWCCCGEAHPADQLEQHIANAHRKPEGQLFSGTPVYSIGKWVSASAVAAALSSELQTVETILIRSVTRPRGALSEEAGPLRLPIASGVGEHSQFKIMKGKSTRSSGPSIAPQKLPLSPATNASLEVAATRCVPDESAPKKHILNTAGGESMRHPSIGKYYCGRILEYPRGANPKNDCSCRKEKNAYEMCIWYSSDDGSRVGCNCRDCMALDVADLKRRPELTVKPGTLVNRDGAPAERFYSPKGRLLFHCNRQIDVKRKWFGMKHTICSVDTGDMCAACKHLKKNWLTRGYWTIPYLT